MTTVPSEKAPKPGLNIYGAGTVNPPKILIMVEELGVPYTYVNLDMAAREHKTEWFLTINPNGRVPAIVHVKEDGTCTSVFESAACLMYIANEFDKEHKLSYPFGTPEYWSQLSWLSWQVAGYGPAMEQACYFNRYAAEPVPFASWHFTSESRRLNHVLDRRLSVSPFVAGEKLTVADFAAFIFAHSAKWCGIDINEWPHVKAWHDQLEQRPAFQRALQIPGPYRYSDEAVSNPDPAAQQIYSAIRRHGGQGAKSATAMWEAGIVPVPSDHANHE